MHGVTRPLCVLVLTQGLCLAAGLWIHDRFLISAVRWTEKGGHEARISASGPLAAGTEQPERAKVAPAAGPESKKGGAPVGSAAASDPLDRVVRVMPAASLIAFIWTLGLQGAVAYLLLSRVQGEHSCRQSKSDEQSLKHTRDLVRTRDAIIFALAKLSESRDPETGHHLERISLYSTRLAAALSRHPKYREVVTPGFVRLIGISSALHDIGKVGIEDSVLLKPAKLTSSERFRMQLHAEVGAECIREIERRLGTCNFLEMAREIAYSHHERWDGGGYPDGISGERIPLAARIVAIADVYDALSVRRVYKDPIPHNQCVAIIRGEAGQQFDPELVRVFLQIETQFREIAGRFAELSSNEQEIPARDSGRDVTHHFTSEQQQAFLAALASCDEPASFLEPAGANA